MGTKNTNSKKTKKNQNIMKSLDDKKIFNQNKISKMPNPYLKRKEIFSHSNCLGFEIYNLKDINNAFYFVHTPYGEKDETIIYKYFYKKERFEKISIIKFEKGYLDSLIIKYFYNPINKKEYLFFVKEYDDIVIILIKNENKFKFIQKKEETKETIFSKYVDKRSSSHGVIEIEFFEIIYNQYDNNIYLIISCFSGYLYDISGTTWDSNIIRIFSFNNDKLILIKEFEFPIKNKYNKDNIINMIYEDKYSKKYYILMLRDYNLQFIEINHKYKKNYQINNFFESKNDLQQFTETIIGDIFFRGCFINKSNDNYSKDYLYLYFKGQNAEYKNDPSKGNFIIIDILKRKIIKKIKLNNHVESILNWNNKYLILQSDKSFYIFDTKINKIISKYSNLSARRSSIESIKTFFSIKNNFYCLFAVIGYINFYTSN